MADADRLEKIASIGQDLITTQLTMAMASPSQALENGWVHLECNVMFSGIYARFGNEAAQLDVFSLESWLELVARTHVWHRHLRAMPRR